ncbi:N-alpha-acetyltransferase, non-catalitic subunit, partial [Massospora cicadina]
MSVIEIMDPKMDSGLYQASSTLEQLEYDVLTPLSLGQLVGVIDHLFCCEAYVAGTLICAHLVWSEMIKGNVHDEEDFSINRTGLPFYAEVSLLEAVRMLEMAQYWIDQQSTEDELQLWEALSHRVCARISYLKALSFLSHDACLKYPQAKEELEKTQELFCKFIRPCAQALHVKRAFNPMIICTFHSSAPPRPLAILPLEAALNAFRRTLAELLQVCTCISYKNAHDLSGFLRRFGAQLPDPSPVARSWLLTTIHQDCQCFGQFGMNRVGREHIEILCPWTMQLFAQPHPIYNDAHQALATFEGMFAQYTLQYYKLRGKNKSRQRRCLFKLLAPLDLLLMEAQKASALVQPWAEELGLVPVSPDETPSFSFEALVMRQQYEVMVELLVSGFLLELYSRYEWVVVHYYLTYILEYQVGFYIHNLGWSDRPTHMGYDTIYMLKKRDFELMSYPQLLMIEGILALVHLHLSTGSCFLLNMLIKNKLHPAPFPATFPSNARRSLLDEAFRALQSDEKRFHHRFDMLNQVRFLPHLNYHNMVSKHTSFQTFTTEDLVSQGIHHFTIAKDLCQELKCLATEDPLLFSAGLTPDLPAQEIQALYDAAHSNLTFLNLKLETMKAKPISFSDPTQSK